MNAFISWHIEQLKPYHRMPSSHFEIKYNTGGVEFGRSLVRLHTDLLLRRYWLVGSIVLSQDRVKEIRLSLCFENRPLIVDA